MAVKPKHHKSKRRAVRGGVSRLRKQHATPTPDYGSHPAVNGSHHDAGVLRPDAASWQLHGGLAEMGETKSSSLMPGQVVIAITVLAIAFIAIITWFVSQMPDK